MSTDIDDLLRRLREEGRDAFAKQYSLGMWKLCAEAANTIEKLRSPAATCYHEEACPDWVEACGRYQRAESTLKHIESLSDRCVNADHYTAAMALDDLQAIRKTIKMASCTLSSNKLGGEK